ncbi:hypothetical protein [Streptomyces sp. NPDC048659]|uniref:hypothetical protein n=1 Tax=Streptomyces sp. NPDC048659 TaxID=3155489 RepID=UPI0034496A38
MSSAHTTNLRSMSLDGGGAVVGVLVVACVPLVLLALLVLSVFLVYGHGLALVRRADRRVPRLAAGVGAGGAVAGVPGLVELVGEPVRAREGGVEGDVGGRGRPVDAHRPHSRPPRETPLQRRQLAAAPARPQRDLGDGRRLSVHARSLLGFAPVHFPRARPTRSRPPNG